MWFRLILKFALFLCLLLLTPVCSVNISSIAPSLKFMGGLTQFKVNSLEVGWQCKHLLYISVWVLLILEFGIIVLKTFKIQAKVEYQMRHSSLRLLVKLKQVQSEEQEQVSFIT